MLVIFVIEWSSSMMKVLISSWNIIGAPWPYCFVTSKINSSWISCDNYHELVGRHGCVTSKINLSWISGENCHGLVGRHGWFCGAMLWAYLMTCQTLCGRTVWRVNFDTVEPRDLGSHKPASVLKIIKLHVPRSRTHDHTPRWELLYHRTMELLLIHSMQVFYLF